MEVTASERNAILLLVANGTAPAEIASLLDTDVDTVDGAISTLCTELGVENLTELLLFLCSMERAVAS